MSVPAKLVKELRERTGLGMMDCKKALESADGDMERAIEELRKGSALKAAKKAGRTTADGLLGLRIGEDGKRGALVEVNIETDFAAKNEKFTAFVDAVLDAAFTSGEEDVATLMAGALESRRESLVQEIGENIAVRRVACFDASTGRVSGYLHGDSRKGALVQLDVDDDSLGRDVAMHVTAINPLVVRSDEVPADVLAQERAIFEAQAAQSGKPPEIVEKMVVGKIRKYLAEVSLVDQAFVKDPNTKVGQLLAAAGATCERFVRLEVGEGVETDATDFASEVQAQIRGS